MAKYEYDVAMTCSGCSGAVTRVLKNLNGVSNFEVVLEKKKVFVETDLPQQTVFETISKTGKATKFVGEVA